MKTDEKIIDFNPTFIDVLSLISDTYNVSISEVKKYLIIKLKGQI